MPRSTSQPDDLTDDALVSRVTRGDHSALDVLFRRHRDVAYRVAYRLLGNESDALDAVQDGFVNAITHLNRYGRKSSFKTWLLRVVTNASLDLGRIRRRLDSRFPDGYELYLGVADDRLPVAGANLERADLRRVIDQALAALPEPQRTTFVLHADGGLSYQEIADTLGIALGTVMSRLYYARQRLKSLLAHRVTP